MSSEPRRVRLLEASERVAWGRLGGLAVASAFLLTTAVVGVEIGVTAVELVGVAVDTLASMPYATPVLLGIVLALTLAVGR